MIRFITFLLNKPYETCKSCETLKQQLELANEDRLRLTETLLEILKPKVHESSSTELVSTKPIAMTFARRRAALEAKDREEARILKNSTVLGKSDDELRSLKPNTNTVEQLEEELGITNEEAGVAAERTGEMK